MSRFADTVGAVYDRLISSIDSHIERLRVLEDALDAELRAVEDSLPVPSYHEPLLFSDIGGDDDDGFEHEDITSSSVDSDSDSETSDVVMSLSQMRVNMPRVRFENTIYMIEDDDIADDAVMDSGESTPTVGQRYTPFNARYRRNFYDSDEESDTDTFVPDWEDPSRTPDFGYDDDLNV